MPDEDPDPGSAPLALTLVDRLRLLDVRQWAAGAAAAVALGGALLVFLGGAPELPEASLPMARPAAESGSAPGSTAPSAPAQILVHAAGAVHHPGVYRLPNGARVADLIELAGGPTAEADIDQLNLAAKLEDGSRIRVPRRGEVLTADAPAAPDGSGAATVLDLNTATAAQLDDLPGVGPATAKAIVDWRTTHGRFRSVEQLLEVRGIGEAKLEQLRGLVRV